MYQFNITYIYRMKKFMIGLFALALLMFSAPVSFASDGPETTKDCVVSADNVVETFVIAGEATHAVTLVSVLGNVSFTAGKSTKVDFDTNVIAKSPAHYRKINTLKYIDPRRVVTAYNSYTLKDKTNGLAYKFINKNCRTRQLSKS